jgi:hypothetical protein
LLGAGGGIPGFPAGLAYGHYRADRWSALPELAAYFAGLADFAAARGKRPVHGLVRSSLRVDWFRAHVPGAHIFIRRAPRGQFLSILRQAVKGNPYFLQRGLTILSCNRDDPVFAPLLAVIDLPALSALFETGRTPDAFAWQPLLPQLYAIFYFIQLLGVRHGERHCDLIVDIDRISRDPAHRRAVEADIARLTGLALSLADCDVERYERNLEWSNESFDGLEKWTEEMVPAEPACPPGLTRRDAPGTPSPAR